jgi:hypothetical protein
MRLRAIWLALFFCTGAAAQTDAPAPRAVSFAQETTPAAPDYAQAESWAARAEREQAALAHPANASPVAIGAGVDVFYVHPTTFRSMARWNQRIEDAETNDWTDRSVIARQASAFNGCCRIYAPRYRQASLRAFSSMQGDGGLAYALAYGDVMRAFDWYMAHENGGRPFILVGHSQGALHVFNLLRDRIDGRPAGGRMVAAYAFGYGIMTSDFGKTFTALKPCTAPRQTRCVIGWNSFLAGADATAYAARARRRLGNAEGKATGGRLLCSDPLGLGGRRRPSTLGALPAGDSIALPPLVPGGVTTACDADGVLKVVADPALGLAPLPGGNMHYHDVALFYADLRADAARRVTAFR